MYSNLHPVYLKENLHQSPEALLAVNNKHLLKNCWATRSRVSSVQFSHSLVSDSLWPPWTAAWQDSLSITKSWSLLKLLSIKLVMPSNHLILCHSLLLLPSVFPSTGSFPVSQFFASSGQSIRVSSSILPVNILSWFPLGLTGLISLLFQEFSRVFSSTTVWKH